MHVERKDLFDPRVQKEGAAYRQESGRSRSGWLTPSARGAENVLVFDGAYSPQQRRFVRGRLLTEEEQHL